MLKLNPKVWTCLLVMIAMLSPSACTDEPPKPAPKSSPSPQPEVQPAPVIPPIAPVTPEVTGVKPCDPVKEKCEVNATPELKALCIEQKGGSACESNRWNLDFYNRLVALLEKRKAEAASGGGSTDRQGSIDGARD